MEAVLHFFQRATRQRWTAAAYAYAVVTALGIGYFVWRSPLQVTDCVDNMLDVQQQGFWELLGNRFLATAFLRPFLWAQLDVSFHLANGHYHEMYKTIHVAQLVAVAVLFVHLLRVTSRTGMLAAAFGIVVLFGSHLFAGTVIEGYPINTFLTIVVCCLMAVNLSFGKPAWWRDIAAVLLFVFAAFTVESGLLVWVIVAAAWFAGCRGVSKGAVLATTAAMLAYFLVRFWVVAAGVPDVSDRSSGFGFRVIDPPEIVERFGSPPWLFYAYNVLCQVLTVLFAEPKGGVWRTTYQFLNDQPLPRDYIGVLSTTGATLLLLWHLRSRIKDWRNGTIVDSDRLIMVFVAVLGANAAISYSYTKDVILSPVSPFYAAAVTIAFAHALRRVEAARAVRGLTLAATVALTLLSTGWAARLVGIHFVLHEHAFIVRNDWMWLGPAPDRWNISRDPQGAALVRQLYDEAVRMKVPGTYFYGPRSWRYFEVPW
jgi:hypothetical protein